MIGEIINGTLSTYIIKKRITDGNRPNAEVYLCEDDKGDKYIAKHFTKSPSAVVGLSRYNHYGRRRDGSETVFGEIQQKNQLFPFLVKHIDRIRYNGKWLIILEYVPGVALSEFIYSNYEDNFNKVAQAVAALGVTLSNWHGNGFAHGDPHLDNAIVTLGENDAPNIVLIDYCQIHHKDFSYCKSFDCFDTDPEKRIREDLENRCGKLGGGFRSDIVDVQKELELDSCLVETFDLCYFKSQ
jgi:hypothetical protein